MPESLAPELLDLRERTETIVAELQALEAGLGEDLDAPIPADLAARARERSRELGLFAMTQPTEFGGSEAGPLALAVAREATSGSRATSSAPAPASSAPPRAPPARSSSSRCSAATPRAPSPSPSPATPSAPPGPSARATTCS